MAIKYFLEYFSYYEKDGSTFDNNEPDRIIEFDNLDDLKIMFKAEADLKDFTSMGFKSEDDYFKFLFYLLDQNKRECNYGKNYKLVMRKEMDEPDFIQLKQLMEKMLYERKEVQNHLNNLDVHM